MCDVRVFVCVGFKTGLCGKQLEEKEEFNED